MSTEKIGLPIGERLKATRKGKGLSQQELAKSSGVNQATLSEVENGKYLPGADSIVSLARALGVSTDYLLGTGGILQQIGIAPPADPAPLVPSDAETILAAVQEVNANVERLRTELLSIRKQGEHRVQQVVGGKRKAGGGAA